MHCKRHHPRPREQTGRPESLNNQIYTDRSNRFDGITKSITTMMQKRHIVQELSAEEKIREATYSHNKVEVLFHVHNIVENISDKSSEVTKEERGWQRETKEITQNRAQLYCKSKLTETERKKKKPKQNKLTL